jgi:hypothetical protein
MKTLAVNLKYSSIHGESCSFMVEKVSLLYLNSRLETEKLEKMYLASGSNAGCRQSRGHDEVDGINYTFKNIEFEQINREVEEALKDVDVILYGNTVEREFLKNFVDDNVSFVQIK